MAQDDVEAFRLFQGAATKGLTSARIKLGYMYSTGRGTTKDLRTAYMWISAAQNAGDKRGDDLLRSLTSQLTAPQIAEAQEQARHLNSPSADALSAKALLP